jgi:peptidoglycan/LPS O-acetylase OafA/YrhL
LPAIPAAQSLVLDTLRFGAALTVCLSHLAGDWISGGMLWQIAGYQRPAVIIFFVLSGFIIASTTRPADGAATYVAARSARLLSVALPALLLTALCDALGQTLAPDFYYGTIVEGTKGDYVPDAYLPLRYLLNALHLQEWWIFSALPSTAPGTNAPFWSLSYEACYYAAWAMLLFCQGLVRAIAITILMLLAGPFILALWPLWLLGAALWHVRGRLAAPLAWPLIVAGLALLASRPLLVPLYAQLNALLPHPDLRLFSDYSYGFATALILLGSGALHEGAMVQRLARPVRRIADHTFELYVMHIPVAMLAAALLPTALPPMLRYGALLGCIFLVVIATAPLCSALRQTLRRTMGARP